MNISAKTQLKALGYSDSDTVFYRAIGITDKELNFLEKNYPQGARNKTGSLAATVSELESLNQQAYGIYLVVNGQGHNDADVTTGKAVFYEHDNMAKELQINLWQSLGLPEPTLQVDTGGKSVHSYWVFDAPCQIGDWKILQSNLLEFADADRSIKNPSRVMRLAGFKHQKTGELAHIVSNSGTHYSFDQIRGIVPAESPEENRPILTVEITVSDTPLQVCLSKDSRESLVNGAGEGGRNATGAKLARDLIGTAAELQLMSVRTANDPRSLFDQFCGRCSPPIERGEANQIWNSAEKSNPGASLSTDKMEVCIAEWRKRQQRPASAAKSIASPQSKTVPVEPQTQAKPGDGFDKAKTTTDVSGVSDQIRLILDSSATGSVLMAEKIKLRIQSGLQEREFSALWDLIVAEDTDNGIDAESVDRILNAKLSSLALETVLDPDTARLLNRVARNKALRPELYLMSLLTATGSLAQNGTKLTVHKGEEFELTPNIFTAIVAPSSQKKSVVLKTMITRPMRALKAKAREDHKAAVENWKYRQKQAAKNKEEFDEEMPCQEVFYFGSATGEAIFAQASRCKHRGLLAVSDELAGHFKGQNQYRGGKGADAEDILSLYDGFVDRTTLRAEGVKNEVDVLNYGVIGGIQPGVLKKFLGDCEDTNGNWARFIFITQPVAASTLPDEYEGHDLSDMLASVYERIAAFKPMEYKLSKGAFKVFQGYFNRLEIMRESEPNSALQSVIGKSAGRIGKLALCLHLFAAAKNNVLPTAEIDAETITKAAHIARLAIDQLRAIYAEYAPEEKQSPVMARIIELSRNKGAITARIARQGLSKSVVISAPEIREMFIALAAKGFGSLTGEGSSLAFLAHNKNAEPELAVVAAPEPEKVEPVVGLEVTIETAKISEIDQELGKIIFVEEEICADLYDDPGNTKGAIVKLETVTRFDVKYSLVYVRLTCGETIIALPDWLKPLTS